VIGVNRRLHIEKIQATVTAAVEEEEEEKI